MVLYRAVPSLLTVGVAFFLVHRERMGVDRSATRLRMLRRSRHRALGPAKRRADAI